jgi:hypothetical protein
VIARRTLEKLGSEAELAAVIAHELAHVEGHHGVVSLFGRPPDDDFKNRRDAEAIADERAVWLLERAGYAPTAMASALRAVLEQEDDEHPLRADRIARATVLAGGRTGFVGRDELLGHLAHMVIGADPRLGARIGASWVVAALGLAIDLEDGDLVRADHDVLALSRDRSTLIAYAVGAPWGRELAARLEDREVIHADAGDIAVGTVPYRTRHPDQPLAKLAAAVRSTLPQPAPGTRVAIAVGSPGALVIEIGGRAIDSLTVREATADEIAATEPARLVIVHAPRTGIVEQLHACAFPLDPDRRVAAGEAIKCSDRRPLDESNL